MATAYRYVGEDERDYPTLGFSVKPGDVLYLDGRPPADGRFVEHEAAPAEGEEQSESADWRNPITDDPDAPALKQPNKAALAADWTAYAIQDGRFEQATGTHPSDATRAAVVEFYTSIPEGGDSNQSVPPSGDGSQGTENDEAPKE